MLRKFINGAVFTIILSLSAAANSHGLDMSTASVQLRDKTHLIITLRYDLLRVLSNSGLVISSENLLQNLATQTAEEFKQTLQALEAMLSEQLYASLDNQRIQNLRLRFPASKELQGLIKTQLMQTLTSTSHNHRPWSAWLEADAILTESHGELSLHFPSALGDVLTTFSKPQTRIVLSGHAGAVYTHSLELNSVNPVTSNDNQEIFLEQ